MSRRIREAIQAVDSEFQGIDLGDKRRDERARSVAGRITSNPTQSFPELTEDSAELEALYRLTTNEAVTFDAILAPHIAATARRCVSARVVLAIHDMSQFKFPGLRDGLVEADDNSIFHALFTLAAQPSTAAGDSPMPLGVLALQPFLSERGAKGATARGKPPKKDSRAARYNKARSEKESFLWDVAALSATQAAGPEVSLIHVVDQEGDDYGLLSLLAENDMRFIVRGNPDRRVLEEGARLPAREILEEEPHTFFREVPLAERKFGTRAHPARSARMAELHVRATRVTLPATKSTESNLEQLSINVVHVFEPAPPNGEPAVEWALFTTEPIDTLEQIRFIVDAYRARWLIEEFFKALKTGCAYEERQLCTGHALLNVLALCVPIAWRMLFIRAVARSSSSAGPASLILGAHQLHLLRVLRPKAKLGANPTVAQALEAIASLGGHLKNNGPPGWLILWRGYRKLLQAQLFARQFAESDVLGEL